MGRLREVNAAVRQVIASGGSTSGFGNFETLAELVT